MQGCTSNVYLYNESGSENQPLSSKKSVYVVNPAHKNYSVLQRSGIYTLSAEENTPAKLTIQDEEFYPACGNPMIGAVITLGLLPGYLDESEGFRYSLEESGKTTEYIHHLAMYRRISIWEWLFKPFQSEDEVKAKALSVSRREGYKVVSKSNLLPVVVE